MMVERDDKEAFNVFGKDLVVAALAAIPNHAQGVTKSTFVLRVSQAKRCWRNVSLTPDF